MTRRRIVFIDPQTQQLFSTPEFNGDRTELLRMRSMDSCDKDWPEIFDLFRAVKTTGEFIAANEEAQGFYHSFLDGICPEPIEMIQDITFLSVLTADEVIRLNF